MEGADLSGANLTGTDFTRTNLEGTNFREAILIDANFEAAIVDGKTLIWDCIDSKKTDFTGVGLDSARVSPILKERLKGNIRKIQWEDYYKRKPTTRWPVHLFWKVSDYGRSTTQIVNCFIILSLLFALIYYLCGVIGDQGLVANLFYDHGGQNQSPAPIEPWVVPFRAVYFSIVTMTTLGFGDMYANSHSILGHILLTIQVILGYGLLGALVTRFGVLFTSSGPSQD